MTVAQAVHWFDRDAFYAEVRRTLKPAGLIAIWCYERTEVDAAVDLALDRFYRETVGPYWPPERRHIETCYEHIRFPFEELETPAFDMHARWRREDLLGYVGTWSAVREFRRSTGSDPLPELAEALDAAWLPRDDVKSVSWPLSLRLGRMSAG